MSLSAEILLFIDRNGELCARINGETFVGEGHVIFNIEETAETLFERYKQLNIVEEARNNSLEEWYAGRGASRSVNIERPDGLLWTVSLVDWETDQESLGTSISSLEDAITEALKKWYDKKVVR